MTKDAIRKSVGAQLSEYFDGYVIVGRVAGSKSMVVSFECDTVETKTKLLIGLVGLLQSEVTHHSSDGSRPI